MATYIPKLARRDFIRIGGVGVAGYSLLPIARAHAVEAKEKIKPRGNAEVVIFIFLEGGPPQMDTLDAKESKWSPEDFDLQTIKPGLMMPMGLLPELARRNEKYAIVRSMESWESEHNRAAYYLQAGRIFSPARAEEIPSIGSVVAYETMDGRKEADFLPSYVAIDMYPARLFGEGILPASCAAMPVNTSSPPPFVLPDAERATYERRCDLLAKLDHEWRGEDSRRGRIFSDIDEYYKSAYSMLDNPKAGKVFQVDESDHKRYGDSNVGDACIMARNLVEADAGTKFIMVNHGNNLVNTVSWDFHGDIYKKEGPMNTYSMCKVLDTALANLLDDLEAKTDNQGRRLIDKTLILCMGEFGRTPGPLNANEGRDHYRYANVGVFAGAGVEGGRILGGTDEIAAHVIDPGWQHGRSIYPEDVLVTLYSSLGIDWTKKITQTPSGRAFEYIEDISPEGMMKFHEISELYT